MSILKLLLLLVSIINLIECSAQEKEPLNIKYEINYNNKIELVKIDSINLNANYFNTYILDSLIYTFDKKEQKICIYSENAKELISCHELKFKKYIVSIYPMNRDSIYCLFDNELFLLSNKFEVITKYKFKRKKTIFYTAIDNFQFYIENNKCYIQKYNIDCFENQKDCFTENIETIISLENNTYENINVNYSEMYRDNDYTANLRGISRVKNKNLHIYNFAIDPNLYVYNKLTKETKVINASAENQDYIKPFNKAIQNNLENKSQETYDYFYKTPQYIYLNYDKYRKYYFRIYFHGQELRNEEGFYNEYLDRQTILIVFDEFFRKIAEIEIDTKKYNYGIVPLVDGIAIPRREYVNNKPQYDIFKFKDI